MGLRDYLDIILALVAVISVTIAVLTYGASRKDKQPNIRTNIYNGLPIVGGQQVVGEPALYIEIANAGDKPIRIVNATFTIKNRQLIYFHGFPGTKEIPFDLVPNDHAIFWMDLKKLHHSLYDEGYRGKQKIKGYFKDTVGGVYISKPFPVDVGK